MRTDLEEARRYGCARCWEEGGETNDDRWGRQGCVIIGRPWTEHGVSMLEGVSEMDTVSSCSAKLARSFTPSRWRNTLRRQSIAPRHDHVER